MSAAVLERHVRPHTTHHSEPFIPARPIERVKASADLGHFFGLQIVQTQSDLCHLEIEAGDCLEVDFDRREIRHDGLYLISIRHDDDGGGSWYGARRFAFRPTMGRGCELWGFDICAEQWAPVSADMQSRISTYGEIREVFKPMSKLRKAAK